MFLYHSIYGQVVIDPNVGKVGLVHTVAGRVGVGAPLVTVHPFAAAKVCTLDIALFNIS